MLEMVDYYGGTILILALASFEIIAFNWIYGTNFIGRYCYSFNPKSNIQNIYRFMFKHFSFLLHKRKMLKLYDELSRKLEETFE